MLPKALCRFIFLLAYTNKFPFLDFHRHRTFLQELRERTFAHYGMIKTEVAGGNIELDVRQWVDFLCWIRRFERAELRFLSSVVKPGATVFDVGANIGIYTLMLAAAAGRQGRVFAFEPSPATYERLQQTLAKNTLPQVVAEPVALGRETATLTLNVTGDLGYSSFGLPVQGAKVIDQRIASVTTLDCYCAKRGITRIDLLKMDVEGFELNVLGGAKETLARNGIREMVVEYNRQAQVNNGFGIAQLVDTIRAHGFHVAAIGESGREPFNFTADIEYAVLHCRLKQ